MRPMSDLSLWGRVTAGNGAPPCDWSLLILPTSLLVPVLVLVLAPVPVPFPVKDVPGDVSAGGNRPEDVRYTSLRSRLLSRLAFPIRMLPPP